MKIKVKINKKEEFKKRKMEPIKLLLNRFLQKDLEI
jgi:hypothetical protein